MRSESVLLEKFGKNNLKNLKDYLMSEFEIFFFTRGISRLSSIAILEPGNPIMEVDSTHFYFNLILNESLYTKEEIVATNTRYNSIEISEGIKDIIVEVLKELSLKTNKLSEYLASTLRIGKRGDCRIFSTDNDWWYANYKKGNFNEFNEIKEDFPMELWYEDVGFFISNGLLPNADEIVVINEYDDIKANNLIEWNNSQL
jgi:hypothetical protein